MKQFGRVCAAIFILLGAVVVIPYPTFGDTAVARKNLSQLLLGKQVKSLIDLPATKEGLNIYFTPPHGKRTDSRGLDLGDLTKRLKSNGVGVQADATALITDVKFDRDRVEVHLGGGGEGRRGAKHASKISPGFQRAGGSRINFRYGKDITEADLQPEAFLKFMGRILDVSSVQFAVSEQDLSPEIKSAIASKTVVNGMTYQMVLMSFGNPEQKQINGMKDGKFSETWYYLKDGKRWVLNFENGKIASVQQF